MDIKKKIKKIKIHRTPYYIFLNYHLTNIILRKENGNDNYFYQGKIIFIYYIEKNILWYNFNFLRSLYFLYTKNNIYANDLFIDDEFKDIILYYFNNKYSKKIETYY